MQHRIILRAAFSLFLVLLITSLTFGWASTFRERRLAGRESTGAAAEPYDARAAAAAYDQRCRECHGPAGDRHWLPDLQVAERELALFDFLQEHAKASPAENRQIARYLANIGSRNGGIQ